MGKKLYSVKELVNSIIEEYQLSTDDWLVYRQKISRTLKKTGLWDNGISKKTGNKTIKYFTEHQRQILLAEESLYNYLIERSQSPAIKESKKYKEIKESIEERRVSYLEYLYSQETHDNDANTPIITDREFREYKKEMMLTALFEHFFTSIDEDFLLNDLYQVQIISDELNLTPEDIRAEHRLSHPEGFYYKKRDS